MNEDVCEDLGSDAFLLNITPPGDARPAGCEWEPVREAARRQQTVPSLNAFAIRW